MLSLLFCWCFQMKTKETIRLTANIAVNVGFSLLLAFTDILVCCFLDRVNKLISPKFRYSLTSPNGLKGEGWTLRILLNLWDIWLLFHINTASLKKSRAPVVLRIETLTGGILEVYNFWSSWSMLFCAVVLYKKKAQRFRWKPGQALSQTVESERARP